MARTPDAPCSKSNWPRIRTISTLACPMANAAKSLVPGRSRLLETLRCRHSRRHTLCRVRRNQAVIAMDMADAQSVCKETPPTCTSMYLRYDQRNMFRRGSFSHDIHVTAPLLRLALACHCLTGYRSIGDLRAKTLHSSLYARDTLPGEQHEQVNRRSPMRPLQEILQYSAGPHMQHYESIAIAYVSKMRFKCSILR